MSSESSAEPGKGKKCLCGGFTLRRLMTAGMSGCFGGQRFLFRDGSQPGKAAGQNAGKHRTGGRGETIRIPMETSPGNKTALTRRNTGPKPLLRFPGTWESREKPFISSTGGIRYGGAKSRCDCPHLLCSYTSSTGAWPPRRCRTAAERPWTISAGSSRRALCCRRK